MLFTEFRRNLKDQSSEKTQQENFFIYGKKNCFERFISGEILLEES